MHSVTCCNDVWEVGVFKSCLTVLFCKKDLDSEVTFLTVYTPVNGMLHEANMTKPLFLL